MNNQRITDINNIIENHFTEHLINIFNIEEFNNIVNMLTEYDNTFTNRYNNVQNENLNLFNDLLNNIKTHLDITNYETVIEMVQITNNLYRNYTGRGLNEYQIDANNIIKCYIYLYLYFNNYIQERDLLILRWNDRQQLPQENNYEIDPETIHIM
tara:strand:+ start:2016 stop:2480 length:465 start_codon:yes stop_codon:yes gene_type:complete